MTARRGYLLIEMIVAMTLGTTLTGIAVGLVVLLARSGQSGRHETAVAVAQSRMAEQFRQDAHNTRQFTPLESGDEKNGAAWQLQQTDGTSVEYRASPGRIVRLETAQGRPVRHESYGLAEEDQARIRSIEDSGLKLLRLEILRRAGPGEAPCIRMAIDGVLRGGSDRLDEKVRP